MTESEAIPKTTPEENVEPLEHEAPIIYGIDPEHMGEVIRESVTVHDAEFGAEVTRPEIKDVVPLALRLGLLISAVLFGIVWLYLRFKR